MLARASAEPSRIIRDSQISNRLSEGRDDLVLLNIQLPSPETRGNQDGHQESRTRSSPAVV
jgi:hypothetical protein